jgi:organic radical activating enzyme
MTDQHPGYREDWDITSEAGSLCFASAIYSRLVGGEQDEATFQWLAKYLRANAAPHHISAMTDQHQHRASINLNDDVKVKLTDYGRDLLAKKRLTRQPDEAGYIKFQLWELMNIFGSYVCNGCSIPCNGCSIPFTFNRILLAPFNPAMTDQLRARVEALEELHKAVVDLNERFNLDPLVARVEALEARYETQRQATLEWSKNVARWIMELEAGQKTKPSPAVDRVLALQDQIRDGALSLADALKEIDGDDQPVQQFIAKYLFTDGNIQQDSFCYDPSDSNSVSVDIANLELVNGCLKPGDNIKIAHRWGELPASDVYSTINYKVVSVSETENRAWTIRAVRVDTSDSEPDLTPSPRSYALVERVQDAIDKARPDYDTGLARAAIREARAAIREVAAWLQENPGPNSAWRAVARDLIDEANR